MSKERLDYEDARNLLKLPISTYLKIYELIEQNKRYREAMKKIRKLTETDAGTEEQVFIIADNILLEDD